MGSGRFVLSGRGGGVQNLKQWITFLHLYFYIVLAQFIKLYFYYDIKNVKTTFLVDLKNTKNKLAYRTKIFRF